MYIITILIIIFTYISDSFFTIYYCKLFIKLINIHLKFYDFGYKYTIFTCI